MIWKDIPADPRTKAGKMMSIKGNKASTKQVAVLMLVIGASTLAMIVWLINQAVTNRLYDRPVYFIELGAVIFWFAASLLIARVLSHRSRRLSTAIVGIMLLGGWVISAGMDDKTILGVGYHGVTALVWYTTVIFGLGTVLLVLGLVRSNLR